MPAERHADALVTIDKLDKIGKDGVAKELAEKGFTDAQIAGIARLDRRCITRRSGSIRWRATFSRRRRHRRRESASDRPADGERRKRRTGCASIRRSRAGWDTTPARSWRSTCKDLPGSLGGGGRYDNLIGMFLGRDVPACGFSLGLERIIVVMQERGMFPPEVEQASIDVVVAALDEGAQSAAMETGRRAAP